jgi:hypothetical protein
MPISECSPRKIQSKLKSNLDKVTLAKAIFKAKTFQKPTVSLQAMPVIRYIAKPLTFNTMLFFSNNNIKYKFKTCQSQNH